MMTDAIDACLAGSISPQVAVSRLLLGGGRAAGILAALEQRRPAAPDARWTALRALIAARRDSLDALSAEIAAGGADHGAIFGPDGSVDRVAAFFDNAVSHSPEASVALYSLGDPAILAEATAEIVAWLSQQGLLRAGSDVLDLGCGIGRVTTALAPRCRSVLGLDVSQGMVAEARRRCAGLANVRIAHTTGQDLAVVGTARFDLLLAVDSFPYIVQVGGTVVDRHLAGAAQVLRPGGALVILNLAYGRPAGEDSADAARWARRYGFTLLADGIRPFSLWDGTAFVLSKPAAP